MSDPLLRRKQVCARLGVSRSTLRRLEHGDPSFPKFWRVSLGVYVLRESVLSTWQRRRELQARTG